MTRQISRFLAAWVLLGLASASWASTGAGRGYWIGTIGDLPVQMDLDLTGDKAAGSYYYDRTGIPLKLTGTMDADGTLHLSEQTPKENVTGFFRGAAPEDGGKFAGAWTAADGSKSLPFRFHRAAAFGSLAVPPADDLKGTFGYPVFAARGAAELEVNSELERFARDRRDEFLKSAAAARAGAGTAAAPAALEPNWEADLSWEIHYDSSTLISLLAASYEFTGGAHGGAQYTSLNYRVHDGKASPVKLKDLFTPGARYVPALNRLCLSQLREQDAAWVVNGQVKEFKEDELSTFVLRPDGLTIIFCPYLVGPWAQGTFRATIAYRDLKGLVDPSGLCGEFLRPTVAKSKSPAQGQAKPAAAVINASARPNVAHSITQEEAVKLVADLPEIRKYFASVEQSSHGQRHAVAMGQGHGGAPSTWEIYVGDDRPDGSSVCWNRFRVDQRTGAILVWNAPSYNALIPLATWQQQQSARAGG